MRTAGRSGTAREGCRPERTRRGPDRPDLPAEPREPCDKCGAACGPFPFYFRLTVFTDRRARLCPRCAGKLVNAVIGYLRSRQRELKAPLEIETAWAERFAKDREEARVLAINRPLPFIEDGDEESI